MYNFDVRCQIASISAIEAMESVGLSISIERAICIPSPYGVSCSDACYLAAKYFLDGEFHVCALTVPLNTALGLKSVEACGTYIEDNNPVFRECPPYILEVLTPARTDRARRWRRSCAERFWDYRISVNRNFDGTRDIEVILSDERMKFTILAIRRVTDQRFWEIYEDITQMYCMTAISAV